MAEGQIVKVCDDCLIGGYENHKLGFLSGEIDTENFEIFEREIENFFGEEDVIFECSELDYINSAGMGLLISKCSSDKNIVLANLKEEVNDTLKLLGFDELFTIVKAPVFREEQENIQLTVDASPGSLEPTRKKVRNLLQKYSSNKNEIHQVVTSLDETLSNIIEHGLKFNSDETIELNLCIFKNGLIIYLNDEGEQFNPDEHDFDLERFLEDNKRRGLGLYLINELLDKFSYRVTPGGKNLVRLEKKFEE